MSQLLHEIVHSVEVEIKDKLPSLKNERDRIEMRKTLSALEKMIKHIRTELMKESKTLKENRKQKRRTKLNNNIILEKDISNNIEDINHASEEKEDE
jgi:hypothetical protein